MESSLMTIIGIVCGGIFILAFGAGGAYLIYRSIQSRKQASASQQWPQTTGQITHSSVSHSTSTDSDGDTRTSYTPEVEYDYILMGQSYHSRQLAFGAKKGYGNSSKAQAVANRYPVGASVAVFYNPDNPQEAVLERTAQSSTTMMVLGIIFLAVDLCLVCPGLGMLALGMLGGAQ